MINLAIVGYRNYNNYPEFKSYIAKFIEKYGKIDKIISGGAKGTDSMAEIYANEHKIPFVCYPADWSKYGKRAGPIRNQLIVNDCTHMVAFLHPDSIGTQDSINKAKTKNVPTIIIS